MMWKTDDSNREMSHIGEHMWECGNGAHMMNGTIAVEDFPKTQWNLRFNGGFCLHDNLPRNNALKLSDSKGTKYPWSNQEVEMDNLVKLKKQEEWTRAYF